MVINTIIMYSRDIDLTFFLLSKLFFVQAKKYYNEKKKMLYDKCETLPANINRDTFICFVV